MKSFNLNGVARTELGKKAAKAFRAEGNIPCELYGNGRNVHFTCKEADLRKLVFTPEIFVVELNIDGQACKAIVQELQFHPISDRVLHVDFLEIQENKPIVMQVPVRLEGLAAGVKAGGKLTLDMRKLRVRGLYNQMPEKLIINVEKLELGKTMQVKALQFDNLEILNAANAVVCSVRMTRGARGAAAAEAQE